MGSITLQLELKYQFQNWCYVFKIIRQIVIGFSITFEIFSITLCNFIKIFLQIIYEV